MKILVIHKTNPNLEGILLFHLVYENLALILQKEALEMELLFLGPAQEESIFYKSTTFKKTYIHTSFFYFLKSRQTNYYDLLINLSVDYTSLLFYLVIKANQKIRISKRMNKRLKNLSLAEREKVLAESIMDGLVNTGNPLPDLKLNLNLNNEKLSKTSQLINWILQSTNQKPLNGLRYLYLHFKIDKESPSFLEEIIALLKDVLEVRNIKIIIILENDPFQEQTKTKLLALPVSTNKTPLILDFLTYKDFYFWFVLAKKAVCTVTNNSLLSLVSDANDWGLVSSQKETLTKSEMNELSKRLKYYLKHI